AIHEGAGDLPLDLRRVDCMTGVGGGDDAVNLDPSLLADRHLGDRRDIAAVPHELREALIDPGRRLAPAGSFDSGVQNREMLRLQHFAPEFEWGVPGICIAISTACLT